MHEFGLGIRLGTCEFADGELYGALDRLLADTALHRRLAGAAVTIQEHDGLRKAAGPIEQAAGWVVTIG